MTANNQKQRFAELISYVDPGKMVFFGGAGTSTESGIPDFRSAGGVFSLLGKDVPPEIALSRPYFDRHPQEFFSLYFNHMVFPDALPNRAHEKLAVLEELGVLSCVITQNVDGLHQKAGSKNVLELHGSVYSNTCLDCGLKYGLDDVMVLHDGADDGVPRCEVCGSIVKPDVVLYGEPLDQNVFGAAIKAVEDADMLVVAGTSLQVYPAALLLQYFSGDYLVIINRERDPDYEWVDLYIEGDVGEAFDF